MAEHRLAHLDNDHKTILLTVGSKKSKNVKSKGSSQPFPNTNSVIL